MGKLQVKDKQELSFEVMDMTWSLQPPDEGNEEAFVRIVIPSADDTEYELSIVEARELHKKLGNLIGVGGK